MFLMGLPRSQLGDRGRCAESLLARTPFVHICWRKGEAEAGSQGSFPLCVDREGLCETVTRIQETLQEFWSLEGPEELCSLGAG